MKINRRSVLKLLGLVPLAAVLPVKAARKVTNVDVGDATPEQLTGRGQLWVLVGRPKTGKTTFAKVIAESTGSQWEVIDNGREGLKNAALLHGYGSSKNRLVVLSENRNAFENATLESCLETPIAGCSQLAAMADVVLRVEGWNYCQDDKTGAVTRSWRCRVLKDRHDIRSGIVVWYVHHKGKIEVVFSSEEVISYGWQGKIVSTF